MEFFERAHVVKKNNDTDGNMKKQLKQMLYGYKQNDNEVIRNAANVENEDDDSTSVSGFSDLNLTVSSSEGNSTRQRISIIDPDRSSNDCVDGPDHKSIILDSSFNDDASDTKSSDISLSELKDDIQSLSEENSLNTGRSDNLVQSDDHFSMTSTSEDLLSDESSENEPFDFDGKLASKILEKLKLKETLKKKERKKAFEKQVEPDDEGSSHCGSDYSSVELHSESEFDRYSESHINYTNVLSPSFVSVTASDMPNQSLSEVLGDYKYPTIRNLPSETQNVFANNKSGIFSTGNLDDSEVNEGFDSVLPQLGSEINTEITDMETSMDMPIEESMTCYDDTLQSDQIFQSITCYDDTLQSDQIFQRETSTESIDTKFVIPAQIYFGKNCCILVLKHPAEIYIHGKLRVTLLAGEVDVGGFALKDKKYDVYAPNYNCAQFLRTLDHDKGSYGLFGKLTGSGLCVATAEEIVTTLGAHDSVVQLQPLHDRVTHFVEKNFNGTDLYTKTNKNVDGCFRKASEFLGCSLYLMKPWKSLDENISWNQVLKYGCKPQSRGIVCGGKGSGKSTFIRYYVNKLLAAGPVLLIDLDPGQCEVTVAGNVSATVITEPLLGPSFTHLKTPERMLNIGLINTMDNTRRYAAAVREIIAYCHSEPRFRGLPWIVNTMGMCNALGLQFMTLITTLLQPTFMLQIDSKNPKKRFERFLNANTVKELYEKYQRNYLFGSISPPEDLEYDFVVSSPDNVVRNFSLTPRDERYLNFLAYFGSLMNTYPSSTDFLLGIVPYEVDLRNLYIAVNVRINKESICRVINGKIVALCRHGDDSAGNMFTLADKPLQCFGHGLVRGIDEERGLCYVVAPAPAARAGADCVVYADWAPELAGPGALPRGAAAPYRAPAAAAQQRLLSAPRRRYNPLQLLKMSRNPKLKPSSSLIKL